MIIIILILSHLVMLYAGFRIGMKAMSLFAVKQLDQLYEDTHGGKELK